jgi:hypothetical protein
VGARRVVRMTESLSFPERRLERVEEAIEQINHFTEEVEKLDLPAWKLTMQLWQVEITTKFDSLSFWLKLMVAGAWISPVAAIVILWNLLN